MKAPLPSILTGIVLLAGCSRAEVPTRADLDVAVPAAWASDAAPGRPRRGWLRETGNEGLVELVVEAWLRNPDLQATAERIGQAAARARLAGAGRLPQLQFEGGGSRSRQNVFDPGTGLVAPDGLVSPLAYRPPSWQRIYNTGWDVGLTAAWELDVWGRLAAERHAAEAQVTGAHAAWDWARFSLGVNVARVWWDLAATERQLALARSELTSWRETARLSRERFAAGLLPTAQLHRVEQAIELAQAGLEELATARETAVRRLEVLIGRYPAGALTGNDAVLSAPLGPVRAGLPSQLLTRRPDLRSAAAGVLAARERVWSARADLFPAIRLTASGGYRSDELEALLDPERLVWNLAGGLTAPLLDGGRRRATVALRRAQAAEALAVYRASVLRAFGEVERALVAGVGLERRDRRVTGALTAARSAEDQARSEYRRGVGDALAVETAVRNRLGMERQRVGLLLARWQNRFDLYLALGGEPLLVGTERPEATE